MRKLLVCAALVWLAASPARGQEAAAPPVPRDGAPSFARRGDASAEAARLLGSRENRERAWGAYLSGAYELSEHAPLLVGLLEDTEAAADGWGASEVRQAALDGLIRLDAEVEAEKLLPLYPHAPDEVVILLARAPEKNAAALLSLFAEETPGARWVAVANLLAGARARGFAARLLAGLKLEATVYVYDREAERGYAGGGGGGCGGGGGYGPTLGGFPPAGRYMLSTSGGRGAVVLTARRRTVYYLRTGAGGRDGYQFGCGEVERDAYRLEYLADLLGTSVEDLGLTAYPFREVVCRDARGCRRALAALRDEVAQAYAGVLGRLSGEGLLDAAEAEGLRPDLTLRLYDERDGKTFPLPARMSGVKILPGGEGADGGGGAPTPDAPP